MSRQITDRPLVWQVEDISGAVHGADMFWAVRGAESAAYAVDVDFEGFVYIWVVGSTECF